MKPQEMARESREYQDDSKSEVDWNHGKARKSATGEAVGSVQRQLREKWSKAFNLKRKVDEWAVCIFVHISKKLKLGPKKEFEALSKNGRKMWNLRGLR